MQTQKQKTGVKPNFIEKEIEKIKMMIEMIEKLRHGWLKTELTENELLEASYIFDIVECRGDDLLDNGLPNCVDIYLANLVNILTRALNRIEQAQRGENA